MKNDPLKTINISTLNYIENPMSGHHRPIMASLLYFKGTFLVLEQHGTVL